jgi:hypothetical protein
MGLVAGIFISLVAGLLLLLSSMFVTAVVQRLKCRLLSRPEQSQSK